MPTDRALPRQLLMTPREATVDAGVLGDIERFLRATLPFDTLDDQALQRALRALRVAYFPRGTRLAPDAGLRIVRSGAVELRDGHGRLVSRLGEGESFQLAAAVDGERVEAGDADPGETSRGETSRGAGDGRAGGAADDATGTVFEDALIYRLPAEVFRDLCAGNRSFDRHFTRQRDRRLRRAARYQGQAPHYLAPVGGVMNRELLTTTSTSTVREAASAMAQRRVSSILVTDGGHLVGILTDRDLRTRVLAAGLSAETPVQAVMTRDPASIDGDATLLDATLEMTRRSLHHLPVLERGVLAGMITTTDLIAARKDDPVYLVQRISRAEGIRDLAALTAHTAPFLQHSVAGAMQPQPLSKLLTAVSDAVLRRIVELAEADLGPAPVPWAWLAFGSQARAEQLLGADQDNGIVIDDAATDADLPWYEALAGRVCDDLAACGYAYCRGNIMASAPDCRLRLASWRQRVRGWARTPTPDALLRVGIFFDLRAVHGDATLARALQGEMLSQASRNTIFLAALAASLLETRPPLGLFRRFVVERNGVHRDRLDIKKRGVLPITEIVRLHALAHAQPEVNTEERLRALVDAGHLAMADGRNLADALHCVQRVRMQHQSERLAAGAPVDNFVDPRSLSRMAREQLRDAFTIIDEAQAGVRQAYRAGLG